MKIKQKVVNNVTLPVGLSGKGNGNMGVGVGISFGKDTAFVDKKSGLVHFDHVGCDRDGSPQWFRALTKTGGSSESLISEVTGTAASAGMIAGVLIGVFCLFKIDGTKAEKIDIFQKIETKR